MLSEDASKKTFCLKFIKFENCYLHENNLLTLVWNCQIRFNFWLPKLKILLLIKITLHFTRSKKKIFTLYKNKDGIISWVTLLIIYILISSMTIWCVFLYAAADARGRQHWVDKLRATAEYHTANLAQVRLFCR